MYPHRIRLRGPWEYEPADGPVQRLSLPYRWTATGGFTGRATLRRAFGYPGRLADPERAWLVADGLAVAAQFRLNGDALGDVPGGSFAADVTGLLGPRNRLEVVVQAATLVGELWAEVALEIRRSAFLDGVQTRREPDGTVEVTGRVVGHAERPLELYVLADGRAADYRKVEPRPAGEPFAVRLAGGAAAVVRVELIDVSVVWYAVERPVEDGPGTAV